jgi:hypothetical protein
MHRGGACQHRLRSRSECVPGAKWQRCRLPPAALHRRAPLHATTDVDAARVDERAALDTPRHTPCVGALLRWCCHQRCCRGCCSRAAGGLKRAAGSPAANSANCAAHKRSSTAARGSTAGRV